jgi:hypothetical protein
MAFPYSPSTGWVHNDCDVERFASRRPQPAPQQDHANWIRLPYQAVPVDMDEKR